MLVEILSVSLALVCQEEERVTAVIPLSLLFSDVTKIFLFRSRLRFSTLPLLSMSISLCLLMPTKFSCS